MNPAALDGCAERRISFTPDFMALIAFVLSIFSVAGHCLLLTGAAEGLGEEARCRTWVGEYSMFSVLLAVA